MATARDGTRWAGTVAIPATRPQCDDGACRGCGTDLVYGAAWAVGEEGQLWCEDCLLAGLAVLRERAIATTEGEDCPVQPAGSDDRGMDPRGARGG
jgi:hypothetical protein